MIRRLFWDAEVSPNCVTAWRIGRKITLGYENIVTERAIISIAWKFEGEKTVHALHWDKRQNDCAMLKAFNKVINSCDEAVAHYGDGFDWPWFRARCLINGIRTNPYIKTVDTCKMARKLYLNSFKLDYLAKILKVGQKLETDYGLWRKVLDKDPAALEQMVRYNKVDVQILEGVYHKLAEITPAKTHAGVSSGGEKWSCAHCGSKKTHTVKTKTSAAGIKSFQMQCNSCFRFYSISQSSHDKYLKR